MSELPLILVIEDDYPLQGVVEEALREGGFETDILSSAEALTLFKGGSKNYRRSSPKGQAERLGRGEADQGKRPSLSGRLRDGRSGGRLGIAASTQ